MHADIFIYKRLIYGIINRLILLFLTHFHGEKAMLKLVARINYIIMEIVTSGTKYRGIQIIEGTQTAKRFTKRKPVFYWFKTSDETELSCVA